MGNVTKNMFVYEYNNELLIVDCGIGFPEQYMLGVDILIPDVTYIQKRLKEGAMVVGMCLSHGHDDHIAALAYILPMIKQDFPIYGSPLTAAFAQARMEDAEVSRKVQVYDENRPLKLGKYFSVETVKVTHSVPDTRHLIIRTPEGVCYHGSDFKFDMNPVDGVRSDFNAMAKIGSEGVLCALIDCLRIERDTWSPSESSIGETLEREIRDCKGKYIVTLMSSNLHRVQLAVDVAMKHGRKVVFIGRSVEQNVSIAIELGVLRIPKSVMVSKKYMDQYKDNELCLIIAGSQGQPGSSLVRASFGEHPLVTIGKRDKVVFSTEPIPGNESNVYTTIDELAKNGVDLAYSDIHTGLHVSGHAGLVEQQLIVSLLKAKYLFPIGGTERHRVQFRRMAEDLGYKEQQVLLPATGVVMEFSQGGVRKGDQLSLKEFMVDGLGVGDVGNMVLSDRKTMAEEGMVVVVIPEYAGRYDTHNIYVASRGFVFMKHAEEIVQKIKNITAEVLKTSTKADEPELKKLIEKRLSREMQNVIGRTPLIIPVFFSV